jgi:hypothetical protein
MARRTSTPKENKDTSAKEHPPASGAATNSSDHSAAKLVLTIPLPWELPLRQEEEGEFPLLKHAREEAEHERKIQEQINAQADLQRHTNLQLGVHRELPVKPLWMLPATVETAKPLWMLPATLPPAETEPNEPDLEDDLDDDILPRLTL